MTSTGVWSVTQIGAFLIKYFSYISCFTKSYNKKDRNTKSTSLWSLIELSFRLAIGRVNLTKVLSVMSPFIRYCSSKYEIILRWLVYKALNNSNLPKAIRISLLQIYPIKYWDSLETTTGNPLKFEFFTIESISPTVIPSWIRITSGGSRFLYNIIFNDYLRNKDL